MKLKQIFIFFALVMVIFVATIAIFVYKTFSPSRDASQPPQSVSNPYGDPGSQSNLPPPAASTTSPSIPSQADGHTAIDDCIALKSSEAQGKQYERGSLLVSFKDGVTFSAAVSDMKALELAPDISESSKNNFSEYHWLSVGVPRGEEFKWQCLIDTESTVKRANLNTTFDLRQ